MKQPRAGPGSGAGSIQPWLQKQLYHLQRQTLALALALTLALWLRVSGSGSGSGSPALVQWLSGALRKRWRLRHLAGREPIIGRFVASCRRHWPSLSAPWSRLSRRRRTWWRPSCVATAGSAPLAAMGRPQRACHQFLKEESFLGRMLS